MHNQLKKRSIQWLVLAVLCFSLAVSTHAGLPGETDTQTDVIGDVLLFHAMDTNWATDVANWLTNTGLNVHLLEVTSQTPTLDQIRAYPVVIGITDMTPNDPIAAGNVLAEYVDLGGSLILTTFGFYNDSGWVPAFTGRLISDSYSPFTVGTDPYTYSEYNGSSAHPLMNNVNFVSTDYADKTLNVTTGSTIIANFTDNAPFVALKGNVMAINAYPGTGYSGDMAQLLVNAVSWFPSLVDVLFVHATPTPYELTVGGWIAGAGYSVDYFDAKFGTPTLTTLQSYKLVFLMTDSVPDDSVALGDILADYVDLGGHVITTIFDYSPPRFAGRFSTVHSPYHAVPDPYSNSSYSGGSSNFLLTGVSSFWSQYTQFAISPTPGSSVLTNYDDGTPMITQKGRALGLNFYPGVGFGGDMQVVTVNAVKHFIPMGIHFPGQGPQFPTIIQAPFDVTYGQNTFTYWVDFLVLDNNPDWYDVYLDGSYWSGDYWYNNTTFSYDIGGLGPGTYNFTTVIRDSDGNTNVHTFFLTVPSGPYLVAAPDNYIVLELGYDPVLYEWVFTDDNPTFYEIYQGAYYLQGGDWFSNEPITIMEVGMWLGNHTLEIIVYDADGFSTSHLVEITVVDTLGPDIEGVARFSYNLGETGNQVEWKVFDPDPSGYDVYLDGEWVQNGDVVSGDIILIDVDGLDLGEHTAEIVAWDASGNYNSFVTQVIVQDPSDNPDDPDDPNTTDNPDNSTDNSSDVVEPSINLADLPVGNSPIITLFLISAVVYVKKRRTV